MPARLDEVQRLLGGAFRRASPVAEDPELAARCAEHVAGNDRLTPAEQVDIYRRQYWARHLESLEEDYPGLRGVLGEEAFEAFCRAYLEAHPPASFSLRDLGDAIVAFAGAYPGFPAGKEALCRDLLRYEHAFIDIWDGAEPPPLDPARIAAMTEEDWSSARLVLHPLLRRMRFDHPVHRIRDALCSGEEAELSPRPAHLLLFRRDLRVTWQELDPVAFALLSALARGTPLLPACEEVASGLTEAAAEALGAEVGGWFAQWANRGLIVGIESVEHP